MIKAIIFDFDGVILDSEPIHWQACNATFEALGFTVPYQQYLDKYVGMADKDMFPLILADYGYSYPKTEIDHLIQNKVRAYERILKSSHDLKSVRGLADFLASTHPLIPRFAICSGSARTELETALTMLEHGSLKKYFEFIVSSEDVSKGKPSPEGFLKTADQLKIAPKDCLVIEDTQKGITAAKKAKMKVIGLAITHSMETLADADYVVNAYDKIDLSKLLT